MPCPFVHKGLVHQPDAHQAFEGSIDCNFIELPASLEAGNLVLAERLAGLHQDSQDIDSAASAVKLRSFQHFSGFRFQIRIFHFSPVPLFKLTAALSISGGVHVTNRYQNLRITTEKQYR